MNVAIGEVLWFAFWVWAIVGTLTSEWMQGTDGGQ